MPKLASMVAIAASVLVDLATGAIAQTVPPALPLAIICYSETSRSWRVGYLAMVYEDGSALYVPPSGKLAAKMSASGVLEAPSDRPAALDCFGQTLDQLRANGRVIEFQRRDEE